jgi:hypothetical protein
LAVLCGRNDSESFQTVEVAALDVNAVIEIIALVVERCVLLRPLHVI